MGDMASVDVHGEFEKRQVAEDVYLDVLDDVTDALESEGVPYLLVGGIASGVLGRARWTTDIDILIRPIHAGRVMAAFENAGFRTKEQDPLWLYKAVKRDVVVDVLTNSSGGVYLDDEMLRRAPELMFEGRRLRIAPPEDLVVMKALAHSEDTARYWFDALSLVAACDFDWEYLLWRARLGPRRILSLLLYAQGSDIAVPDEAVLAFVGALFEPGAARAPTGWSGTGQRAAKEA